MRWWWRSTRQPGSKRHKPVDEAMGDVLTLATDRPWAHAEAALGDEPALAQPAVCALADCRGGNYSAAAAGIGGGRIFRDRLGGNCAVRYGSDSISRVGQRARGSPFCRAKFAHLCPRGTYGNSWSVFLFAGCGQSSGGDGGTIVVSSAVLLGEDACGGTGEWLAAL